jgi:acetyl-CoA acetyltransferase family protein
MRNAVIVDAVRTPVGRRNGVFKDVHPVDLASIPLQALVQRNDLDPELIDDVIMGNVSQTGEQAYNVGRNAVLAAGFPESVPGVTIDRQCGSSQQAVHFAAQGVLSGAYDVAVACGVEHMTRVPMGSSAQSQGWPFSERLMARYESGLVPQGISAEIIAERWNLSREQLDTWSARSHERALKATREGAFRNEIHPIKVETETGTELFEADEGIREPNMEKIASLQPSFKADGVVTAANSSQISDGAAALLIMSSATAERLNLRPIARFVSFALSGTDPITMLTGPIPATRKALDRAGLSMGDMDAIEINEAFASVVLAWQKELELSGSYMDERVNPNGGAIALGHPLGASGARLMTTLLGVLEARDARYGLQTMCEGGGLSNATIIERLP